MTRHSDRLINLKFFISVAFLLLLCPVLALACKYSVRDVGFVVLDQKYYELRMILRPEVSQEELIQHRQKLSSLLRDTNISVAVLHADSDETSEAERKQFNESNKTVAFLSDRFSNSESSDQPQLRELFLQEINLDKTEAVSEMIWSLSQSTLREQILSDALSAHSILLVVEGTGQAANQKAIQLAQSAGAEVKETLPDLPKLIENPPAVLTVSLQDRQQERILLWSLGVPLEQDEEAYLLPLFGRGRMLGEPLRVPGLSATELVTILGYVGQDCECELDRSWMQGKMFPHRWEEQIQEQAAKSLGFDPGNPLVMTEITRILARGPNVRRNLQVGEVAATDLIDLNQESYEEVSKEAADDILRELNLLPEPETKETGSSKSNVAPQPAPESSEDEIIVADSLEVPVGNGSYIYDISISRSLLTAFEVLTGLLILGLVWFLLRRRRR